MVLDEISVIIMGEYVLGKVKAKYKYTRQNEDELQFEKGAIIQLITKDEGGWYEGKYNGQIGWFPSNYVREIKTNKLSTSGTSESGKLQGKMGNSSVANNEQQAREIQQKFHQQVVDNFVESEGEHVKEMEQLLVVYIYPIKQQPDVNQHYQTLISNLEQIVQFQKDFLKEIEASSKLPESQQHIGQLFEKRSEDFEKLFITYCSNHHKAVQVILQHRDQLLRYLEAKDPPVTNLAVLTSGLSKPFRRLDHYPAVLREIERHINESHSDRICLTKACASFEKISFICQELRKRKESEHHVMTSEIGGWEGEAIASLGDAIYSSSATCFISNEKTCRYLLLFADVLVTLSTSSRMSDFRLESKISLGQLRVDKLQDSPTYQHAFQLQLQTKAWNDEAIIVVTKSAEEQRTWVESLRERCEAHGNPQQVTVVTAPGKTVERGKVVAGTKPVKREPVRQIPQPPRHNSPPNVNISFRRPGVSPPLPKETKKCGNYIEVSVPVNSCSRGGSRTDKIWSNWCLRPSMLCRHATFLNGARNDSTTERSRSPKPGGKSKKKSKAGKHRKEEPETFDVASFVDSRVYSDVFVQSVKPEEERLLLAVIDLYNGGRKKIKNQPLNLPATAAAPDMTSQQQPVGVTSSPAAGNHHQQQQLSRSRYQRREQEAEPSSDISAF